MRIAHLSDLHFGRLQPPIVEALVAELSGQGPDLIVISGDFTMHGRRREFAAARDFLARLRPPVFAVPGNHDMSYFNLVSRFVRPLARYRRSIAGDTEPVLRREPALVVGLNTARPWGPYLNWAVGRLSRGQIERAVHQFVEAPAAWLRVLVTHHPLVEDGSGPPSMHWTGRSRGALERLAEAGVDMMLSGHLHIASNGVYELSGGHSVVVVQAATATSTRLRGQENAYGLIRLEDGAVEVVERRWNGSGFADGPGFRARRLAPGHWQPA